MDGWRDGFDDASKGCVDHQQLDMWGAKLRSSMTCPASYIQYIASTYNHNCTPNTWGRRLGGARSVIRRGLGGFYASDHCNDRDSRHGRNTVTRLPLPTTQPPSQRGTYIPTYPSQS
jgi:hypothetical protein